MKVIDTLNALIKKHEIKGVKLSEVKEVTMSMEGKLTDGTVVATPSDSFEVGAEFYVIDADGNPSPAPDGEHTLEGGMVIVTANGLITEVKEAAPVEEEMSADIAATIAAMDEQLTSIKSQLAEREIELASVKTDLASAKSDLIKSQAKVTELSKKPAATSVKKEVIVENTDVPQMFQKKKTTRDVALSIITKFKNN